MSRFAGMGLQIDTPARMMLIHPRTGEPVCNAEGEQGWFDLLGTDSRVAQAAERATTDRRLGSKLRKLTAAEIRREQTDLLAALTKGWKLVLLTGEEVPIECTTAAAAELYEMPEALWLREAVAIFVADRGNFHPT